jgi:hypothetical protein
VEFVPIEEGILLNSRDERSGKIACDRFS